MDSQVALLLLRLCSGFCKLVHISRSTPPSLVSDALSVFDADVCRRFTESTAIDTSQSTWQQAQLSRGGLGLRQLSKHTTVVYLSSVSSSGVGSSSETHLQDAISHYNSLVLEPDALNVDSFWKTLYSQGTLSSKIEDACFLFHSPMPLPGYISVVPTVGLNLSLEPSEFHTAIKCGLGIPVSSNCSCPYCPLHALDPHNHQVLPCKYGGDVVNQQNQLRDIQLESCHHACISPKLEAGYGVGHVEHCMLDGYVGHNIPTLAPDTLCHWMSAFGPLLCRLQHLMNCMHHAKWQE